MTRTLPPLFLSLVLVAGCAPEEAPLSPPKPAEATTPQAAPRMPMKPPPAKPNDPLTETPTLDQAIEMTERVGDKQAQVKGYVQRGFTRLADIKAGDGPRYAGALADFRKALSLDPSNARALRGKKQAEDTLKASKLPVPK
jgi:hypothetical protein